MCSNYKALTNLELIASYFGAYKDPKTPPEEWASDVYPLGLTLFIRLDENGRRGVETGQFGLVPHWAKEAAYGRKTYNARSETVHKLNSFREAWARAQRCIIPSEWIYEYCYESGNAVRWKIAARDGLPLGIAGIYVDHPTLKRSNGDPVQSFSMLTVNGDGHPVFSRMHGPEDEKRMVVILAPEEFDDWLTCSFEEAPKFFKQSTRPLIAEPAPKAPRTKKVAAADPPD